MLAENTFQDRAAIVTGGGSGIGRAIALELSRLGASVALVGRRRDKLEEVAHEAAEAREGAQTLVLPLDVRDRDAVEAAVEEVGDAFGRVDHLVNAAAGNFRVQPEDMSPNAWDAVVRIVQYGTWHCTQAVGRRLIESGRPGSVLNIGSAMALLGGPDTMHSASAKAAVLAMTKSLAVAWAPHGIRVNVLIPGVTAGTPGVDILYGDVPPSEIVPMGRLGTTQELADAAAYLLSDHASYITGTHLVVDGGRMLSR